MDAADALRSATWRKAARDRSQTAFEAGLGGCKRHGRTDGYHSRGGTAVKFSVGGPGHADKAAAGCARQASASAPAIKDVGQCEDAQGENRHCSEQMQLAPGVMHRGLRCVRRR